MRILAAVQCILAIAFILFRLVTLFGIGITGLLFLLPGAIDWHALRRARWF